jgi:hypothetical protein
MENFLKVAINDYPTHILKTYTEHAKYKLAKKSLIEKDYESLKILLHHMDNFYSILYESIERLDLDAVKLIIDRAKDSDNEYIKNGSYISEYTIKNLFDHNNIARILDIENANTKRVEILKVLLKSKSPEHITVRELQKLSDVCTKEEFEDFYKSKNIDITSDRFKDLELSQYSLKGLNQVLKLENQPNSVIDLLLSRTFSDQLTMEEIKNIYTNLYNLDPIAQEMLVYTGALIHQNSTIKIMFGGGKGSYYSPESNIIKINNSFIDEDLFNTESVVIHEIGHFVYDQLFQFDAMPFDFNPLVKLFQPHMIDSENDQFLRARSTTYYKFLSDQNNIKNLKKLIVPLFQYEEAARKPVDKAAELLRVNKTEYDKYLFKQEYTEYFKQNSYIDVFFLNADAAFSTEKMTNSTIPDHIFDNILNVYLANHDCENYDPFSKNITREEILRWATEEFLPKLVTELNLSPRQIHFLERIADYINRGEHLLEDTDHSDDENEKYVELIVRAMELKAAKIGSDLINSFEPLEQYHKQYVSPTICDKIQNSGINDMPFDSDVNNEAFKCNFMIASSDPSFS